MEKYNHPLNIFAALLYAPQLHDPNVYGDVVESYMNALELLPTEVRA